MFLALSFCHSPVLESKPPTSHSMGIFFPSGVLLRSDEPPHCPQSAGPIPIGLFNGSVDKAGLVASVLAVSVLASATGARAAAGFLAGSPAATRTTPGTRVDKAVATTKTRRFISDRGFMTNLCRR